MTPNKIRVLVVDDSAVIRKVTSDILNRDPRIEVVGTAIDPYVARDKILALQPDVLTLDIEMPRMDGITFVKILMKHHPLPIIVLSALTPTGSLKALEALEAGAVDVMEKPGNSYSVEDLGEQLIEKVKAAAEARIRVSPKAPLDAPPANPQNPPSKITSHLNCPTPSFHHPRQIILMGASTGGTQALQKVLSRLPKTLPGICIVQHIPAYFSKAFAERLNATCDLNVKEAEDGDRVQPGFALVAPGNFHMLLQWQIDHYRVSLRQGPLVWHQRPSVDVLFSSAADCGAQNALAILLTGMGKDGAEGMKNLKAQGAHTLAQSEEDCVVFGMPRAAIELGVVDEISTLDNLPNAILNHLAALHRHLKI